MISVRSVLKCYEDHYSVQLSYGGSQKRRKLANRQTATGENTAD